MEHLESGGFSFSKYKPQYLECYKFRCSLFLSFWVPVKENVAKVYFLLSVLEEKVETLENNFGGIDLSESWAPWPPLSQVTQREFAKLA